LKRLRVSDESLRKTCGVITRLVEASVAAILTVSPKTANIFLYAM